jgi:LytR cell envelope-related transcriptional attenuator
MAWLLAFSVQHEVEKYGAYLAIASFVGLALLSVLYFSQAREVRRLRDWAGRAPERDADLAARVTEQADAARRLQAQPIRRPVATEATQVVAPPAPAAEPATNGHPVAAPLTVPMGPRPATAASAVAAAVGAATAAAAPEAPAAEPEAPAPAPEPPAEGDGETPKSAQPSGNGNGTGDVAAIPRATPRPAPAPRRPAAQPVRAPQRTATVPPRRVPPRGGRAVAEPPQPERRHTRGILIGVVAGIVVIAVAALVISQLGGGGGGGTTLQNTTEPPAGTSSPTSANSAAGPSRAETEVVVLNGTTTEGQAAQAKTTLEQAGYASDHVPTANASNQATTTSTVYYAPNRRRQAALVARALKITRIAPVDSQTKSLADNSSDPPVTSDVVVILGADRTP